MPLRPLLYTFSEYPTPKKSRWKSSCMAEKNKKSDFSQISILLWWFFVGLNFDAIDLPYSSFKLLYPNFFKGTQNVDLVSTVWPPAPPKWGDTNFFHLNKSVLTCFFGRNRFFPAKRLTFAKSLSHIFGKLMFPQSIWANFNASYEASKFCWQITPTFVQYLRLCHIWSNKYI